MQTYLFFDVETEGLEPQDAILEVGYILTDDTMQDLLAYGSELVDIGREPRLNRFVHEMHTNSGLLQDLASIKGRKLWEVENTITAMLDEFASPGDFKPMLAGSGVHFDKALVDKHMPNLSARLHYRIMDSSQVGRFLQDVVGVPEDEMDRGGDPAHRAYEDCEDARRKLVRYRDMIRHWRKS